MGLGPRPPSWMRALSTTVARNDAVVFEGGPWQPPSITAMAVSTGEIAVSCEDVVPRLSFPRQWEWGYYVVRPSRGLWRAGTCVTFSVDHGTGAPLVVEVAVTTEPVVAPPPRPTIGEIRALPVPIHGVLLHIPHEPVVHAGASLLHIELRLTLDLPWWSRDRRYYLIAGPIVAGVAGCLYAPPPPRGTVVGTAGRSLTDLAGNRTDF